MSQPGFVGLEGEPWAQRSRADRKPEWPEGAGKFRGYAAWVCQRYLGGREAGESGNYWGQAWGGLYVLGEKISWLGCDMS